MRNFTVTYTFVNDTKEVDVYKSSNWITLLAVIARELYGKFFGEDKIKSISVVTND